MKLTFSVHFKLQTEPLFLLKIKIKQKPDCLNKEYNAIFEHIHLNIRAYPRSKKYTLINNYENIIAYSEESEQSGSVGEQVRRFLPNTSGKSEGQCHLRKI